MGNTKSNALNILLIGQNIPVLEGIQELILERKACFFKQYAISECLAVLLNRTDYQNVFESVDLVCIHLESIQQQAGILIENIQRYSPCPVLVLDIHTERAVADFWEKEHGAYYLPLVPSIELLHQTIDNFLPPPSPNHP